VCHEWYFSAAMNACFETVKLQGLNALFSGGSVMEMMKYGVLGIFAMSVSVALMNYNDD
jgi:hypothetical protein